MPLKSKIMAEKQDIPMNAFKILTNVAYLYGEATDISQGKIGRNTFLSRVLKEMNLPSSATNVIGDYDDLDSGYGYYNNSNDPSGQYAPAGTAGFFIRFRVHLDSISTTFFFPTAAGEHKLWYRVKGGVCVEFSL
jgi:hypothetical protein